MNNEKMNKNNLHNTIYSSVENDVLSVNEGDLPNTMQDNSISKLSLSERKVEFEAIRANVLIEQMENNGFDAEAVFLNKHWDEYVNDVLQNVHYGPDLIKTLIRDLNRKISRTIEKDTFYSEIEGIIGLAVESIAKLRDSAPDGLHAYLITTKPIMVNSEDEAPWEYESDFWDDMLEFNFQNQDRTSTFWKKTTEIKKVENGKIIISFLIY